MNQIEVGAMKAPRPTAADVCQPSLSAQLWNIRWNELLPMHFDEVRVELGTFADALPFVAEHYGAIFGNDDPNVKFFQEPMTDAKRRFSEMSDSFVFRAEQQTVGILIAHPTDWSTYYMRTSAFIPQYRNRHLITQFVGRLSESLAAAGVVRMETETSPTNIAMQRVMATLGWMITGTSNSERWGTLLRATKYLNDDAKAAFTRQFCQTPR